MAFGQTRRAFLVQSGLTAGVCCLPGLGWGQVPTKSRSPYPDISDLIQHLPPEARYEAREMPYQENGYLAYLRAVNLLVDTDVLDDMISQSGAGHRWRSFDYPNEVPQWPEGEVQVAIEEWLAKNEHFLRLLMEAAKRDVGQYDREILSTGFFRFGAHVAPALSVLGQLAKDDVEGAIELITAATKVAVMMLGANCPVVYFYPNARALGSALGLMRIAARDARLTSEDVERLSALLRGSRYQPEWLGNSIRATFHYQSLPLLSLMDRAKDLKALVGFLEKRVGLEEGLTGAALRQRRQLARDTLLEALEGHPSPFDAVETVKTMGQEIVGWIDLVETPRVHRTAYVDADVARTNGLWPAAVNEGLLTQRTLLLPDLVESDLSEALPPTHEEKQQLRNGLVKETNPLGKLMFLGSDWSMMFDQNDELQAAYGLTQVVLAGRLFWERHNRVPNSLNELVEEGFLDHLPIDPYAEVPLRYNPETGLVWSVYKDGRSNEGERMVVIEGGLTEERDDLASPMPRFE